MKKLIFILFIGKILLAQSQDTSRINFDYFHSLDQMKQGSTTSKLEIENVSIISKEFLNPVISIDEVKFKDLDEVYPVKIPVETFNPEKTFKIGVEAGYYRIPSFRFNYFNPIEKGQIYFDVTGSNTREYIENSDKFGVNAKLGINFFKDEDYFIFDKTSYSYMVNYFNQSFKMYGSMIPYLRKNLNQVSFSGRSSSIYKEDYNIIFNIRNSFINIYEDDFSENLLNVDAAAIYKYNDINVNLEFNYVNQFSSGLENNDFLKIKPLAGLNLSETMKFYFGTNLIFVPGKDLFAPVLGLNSKLDKNLYLILFYNPDAEIISNNKLLLENPYYNVKTFDYFPSKQKINLKGELKFEDLNNILLSAGINYITYTSYPYYSLNLTDNSFEVKPLVNLNQFNFEINGSLFSRYYGNISGKIIFSYFKDSEKNDVPFHSALEMKITYGRSINERLKAGAVLDFRGGRNYLYGSEKKLKDYINLEINTTYDFSKKLTGSVRLLNLLNKTNYLWYNYREHPLDLQVGFNFNW